MDIETLVAAKLASRENAEDHEIVEALRTEYRKRHPKARGTTGLFRYTRNGSGASARSCYLCGQTVTWATKWPRTSCSYRAEFDDTALHVANVRKMIAEIKG